MRKTYFIPAYLSCFLLAAHFFRSSNIILVLFWILVPFILLYEKKWTIRIIQTFLIPGTILWIYTTIDLVKFRMISDKPWIPMALILGAVSIFTLFSTVSIENYLKKFLINQDEKT